MLTFGKLIWNRFLWFPNMGMFWDLQIMKRLGDELTFKRAVQTLNEEIAKDPKHQAWFATLFLRDNQVMDLSGVTQAELHPKSYLMLAMPTFSATFMPAIGVWNPCHFVWVNNQKVVFELYEGSKEKTADWLGYRFKGVPQTTVEAYAVHAPADSLSLRDALHPPVVPGDIDNPPPLTPPSGIKVITMTCPNCGQKLGF